VQPNHAATMNFKSSQPHPMQNPSSTLKLQGRWRFYTLLATRIPSYYCVSVLAQNAL
jgi:hypothetical protein